MFLRIFFIASGTTAFPWRSAITLTKSWSTCEMRRRRFSFTRCTASSTNENLCNQRAMSEEKQLFVGTLQEVNKSFHARTIWYESAKDVPWSAAEQGHIRCFNWSAQPRDKCLWPIEMTVHGLCHSVRQHLLTFNPFTSVFRKGAFSCLQLIAQRRGLHSWLIWPWDAGVTYLHNNDGHLHCFNSTVQPKDKCLCAMAFAQKGSLQVC